METINEFRKQQDHTVAILKKLLIFLQEGEEYGVAIDPKLMNKLEIGIKTTSDEKLKVALIGGFSEGKTSIAAAWAEKYDKSTMKINQQESSDQVEVYSMDEFNIIDTPGLFGFKETAAKEKYKDITRKYISEAHLILYIMNPNNPIKESHKEELIWLFKDLDLLPRTVFVLSRFDEEVDIEDDDDYKKGLEIKRQNIFGRLKDFDLISDDNLPIVAVSANPFERGIEYWLSNMDDFKRLSHIDNLQKATTEKIKAAGTNDELIKASKRSIVSDILISKLPVAIERDEKTNAEVIRFQQLYDEKDYELKKTYSRLSEIRIALREYINTLFSGLILQAKGLSLDTVSDFFERNIGKEGIVLSTNIQNEFERQLGSSYGEISKMQLSLNTGVEQYNTVIGQMAIEGIKQGGKYLSSAGIKITNTTVLNARNILMPSFKFKPWGAIKLADKITKALPIIGNSIVIVFELWDSYNEYKKQREFKKGIDEMVSEFELLREEYLSFINDEEKFTGECFPNYIKLTKQLEELHKELQAKHLMHENFKKWRTWLREVSWN